MISRNLSSHLARAATLCAAAAILTSPAACKKKEPPPPPPPPPPPVYEPPPTVSFDSLRQDMGADARVQVSGSISISNEGFARAVVELADALARGDAEAMRGQLTRPARNILDELESTGEWSESTAGIEAVRVVFADPMSAGPQVDLSSLLPEETPQEVRDQLSAALTGGGFAAQAAAMTDEDLEAMAEQMRQLTGEELDVSVMRQAMNMLAAASDQVTGPAVILAVQDAEGAILLGFTADSVGGGEYTFTNAPVLRDVRRRASMWDNIGRAGFSTGLAADDGAGADLSAVADQIINNPDRPADPDAPAEDQPTDDGPVKRTPRGPVKIPTGPGGG